MRETIVYMRKHPVTICIAWTFTYFKLVNVIEEYFAQVRLGTIRFLDFLVGHGSVNAKKNFH